MKTKVPTLASLFPKVERKELTFPLEGKYLIIKPTALSAIYRQRKYMVWQATGGFGCSDATIGGAVFATCVADGDHARYHRSDFAAEFAGDIEAFKKEVA